MNRTFLSLLAALALVGLLAGCGSSASSSSSAAASASGGGGAATATRTKLVACLKAHGVTLPSRPAGARRRPGASGGLGFFGGGGSGRPPGGGPGGAPGASGRFAANPKFRSALQACGAAFPRRRFSVAARRATIQRFVTCVDKHGYQLPKPNLSGQGSVFAAKIATNAKFRAASRSCTALLRPQAAPGGGAA